MVPWRAIEYMIFRAFVFFGALLIGGAAMAQTGQVEIKDAWARATPGKAENGAAYLTIQSPVADRLVGVFSPVAKKAGLVVMTGVSDAVGEGANRASSAMRFIAH